MLSSGLGVIVTTLDAVALMVLVAVVQGRLQDRVPHHLLEPLLGMLCGLVSLVQLAHPLEVVPGILIDLRNMPIAFAAAFFGLRGLLPALVMAAAFRLHLGGAGLEAGLIGLGIAGLAGLGWKRMTQSRHARGNALRALLGAVISLHLLPILLLDAPVRQEMIAHSVPVLAAMNMLSALTAGAMLEFARRDGLKQNCQTAALSDPQTGFLSARGFGMSVAEQLRGCTAPTSIAAIRIGIDLEEKAGPDAASLVMARLGQTLRSRLRQEDIVGRTAEDRITVFLLGIDAHALNHLCRDLHASMDRMSLPDGGAGHARVEIGASLQTSGAGAQGVLDSAEAALREADGTGGVALRIDDPGSQRSLFDIFDATLANRARKRALKAAISGGAD